MDTDKQKEILQNFILEFLPKKGNNRKYPTNEIDRVTQAIEWVCMKYLGFRPTDKEVFDAFNMLGYSMLEKIYDCSSSRAMNSLRSRYTPTSSRWAMCWTAQATACSAGREP